MVKYTAPPVLIGSLLYISSLFKSFSEVEEKNKSILSNNQKLENKLIILISRLEQIEKIALNNDKLKDIAVYQLK